MALQSMFDLTGRVALVTGASGSVGRVLSAALAEYGATVVLIGRLQAPLENQVESIRAGGGRAILRKTDVLDASGLDDMVDDVIARLGRIDILVNAAGTNVRKWAQELTEEAWDEVMDLNVKGAFLACQAAGRVMIRQNGGKIINISSTRAVRGYDLGYAAYCASKGAVNLLTRQLAVEWGKYHINVNAIGPTTLRTPLTAPLLSDPEYYERLVRQTPLGRPGEVSDIVGAAIFLASSASDFVSGQVLYVDGGYLAAG